MARKTIRGGGALTRQNLGDLNDNFTELYSGGGSGAPTDATYVTTTTNSTLTNERVLTAGTGITLTDAGAGSTLTIAATGGGSGDVVGPASATADVPVLFNGTTGKLVKNSTPTGTGNPVLATSPTLTTAVLGDSTANTQTLADNSTKVATTAYVDASVAGGGGGNVSGPGSATDNAIARFDSTTGHLIQNSTGILDDSGNLTTATVGATDATTPSITTASGKTNTGYVQVNGKTSGALKITAADAAAQTLTLSLAAQTSGAATLSIPNQAGASKTVAWLESPSFTTPALGTPSSGTLTSCTGLPVAGLVSSTSTALGVGSLELGDASDTTLTRVSGGIMAVEGKTVATLSGVETFTNTQTFQQIVFTNNAITASGNAATVPITSRLNTVTNNSAATLTITMTTASAVAGQMSVVRILDASGATQTITWVGTENSTVTAPTTSNGSTTLPLTVGFMYNSATSAWRCVAAA